MNLMNTLSGIEKQRWLSIIVLVIIFLYPGVSAAVDIEIGGHIKTYTRGIDSVDIGNSEEIVDFADYLREHPEVFRALIHDSTNTIPDGLSNPEAVRALSDRGSSMLVSESFRVKTDIFFTPWFRSNLAWDLSVSVHEKGENDLLDTFIESGIEESQYRLIDFNKTLYPEEEGTRNYSVKHNLDRMSFTFSFPGMEFYLGRQAFGWGDSRLVSPLDVLTPFQFDDLDKEERAGVDAARFLIPFGTFNEFSGGYVFGDKAEFRNSAVYLRTRLHFLDTDLKLLTLGYRNHLMVGFSSTRSIGGAGIWLEGAWTACGILDSGWVSSNDFFRLTLGSDYNFNEKFYGYAEYHYSSAGKSDPEDYLSNFKTPAYESGGVYLMGRHYLGLGGNFQIMPLLNLGFAGMWNISDLSFSVMSSLEYNVAEDIYISWGGVVGFGKGPAFKSIDIGSIDQNSIDIGSILEGSLDPGSEFGMISNMCYMSMRFYF